MALSVPRLSRLSWSYVPHIAESFTYPLLIFRASSPTHLAVSVCLFLNQLCPGELGAVTAYFDRDRDGAVSVNEFLAQFFRLELAAKPFAGPSISGITTKIILVTSE